MFSTYKPVLWITSMSILVLISCNHDVESKEVALQSVAVDTAAYAPVQEANNAYYRVVDSTPAPAGNEQLPKQSSPQHIDWDKKIIKNATLVVEAKSQKAFNDFVHEQVKRSGGYVSEEEQTKSD